LHAARSCENGRKLDDGGVAEETPLVVEKVARYAALAGLVLARYEDCVHFTRIANRACFLSIHCCKAP